MKPLFSNKNKFNIHSGPIADGFIYKQWVQNYFVNRIYKKEGLDGILGWKTIIFRINGYTTNNNVIKKAISFGADIKKDDIVLTARTENWDIAQVSWGPEKPKPHANPNQYENILRKHVKNLNNK